MTSPIDDLDARLIALMAAEPRIGLMEASRRLNVARGTVQARLAKLTERGVIRSFGPEVDPSKIGYPVLAFVFLEITQGRLIEAIAHLESVPEVLEAHATSGPRDLLCRVAAHDTEQLQEIINRLLSTSAVRRSTSYIVLSTQIAHRTGPLVQAAAEQPDAYRCGRNHERRADAPQHPRPTRCASSSRAATSATSRRSTRTARSTPRSSGSTSTATTVVLNSAQGRRWPTTSSAPAERRCSSPTPRTSTSTSSSRRSSSRPPRRTAEPSSTP